MARMTRSCPSGTVAGSSSWRRSRRRSWPSPARIITSSSRSPDRATHRPCATSRRVSVATELLFAYGTLMRGYRLHRLLAGRAAYLEEGEVQGFLFDLGTYPAALRGAGRHIRGEV